MAELSSYSKEVARGSFWTLAGNVFFKLVSFFYVIMIARAASPDDVGLFYLAFSVVSIISVFSDVGLSQALVRYIPFFEGRGEKEKILSAMKSCFIIILALSILFSAISWLSADFVGSFYKNDRLPEAVRMLSAYVLIGNLFRLNTLYLQSRSMIKRQQLLFGLQNVFKLIITAVLFYLYGANAATLSAGLVVSLSIALILSFRDVRGPLLEPGSSLIDRQVVSEIAPLGFMLTLLVSFLVLISSTDKLMLGYLVSPESAPELIAVYSIATAVAGVLTIFPQSIENSFFPQISRLVGEDNQVQIRRVTESAVRWTLFVTMPVAIVFILFSADILAIFYGGVYGAGYISMSVLTLGLLIRSYSGPLSLVLASMRLVRLELQIYLFVALLNVALNLLLIPTYGMEGAAIATAASFAATTLVFAYYSSRIFGFTYRPEILKLTAAGAAAFILVFLLRGPLSVTIGSIPLPPGGFSDILPKVAYLGYVGLLTMFSVFLFLSFSLLLRCLRDEDVLIMKKVLSRAPLPPSIVAFAEKAASAGVQRSE